jgi:membrane protein implicated in regulation of membrane protease activity
MAGGAPPRSISRRWDHDSRRWDHDLFHPLDDDGAGAPDAQTKTDDDGAGATQTTEGTQVSWWGWVIGGVILLGAELAFVDAQFYLVFIGSAAIIVGVLTAAAPSLAPWAQWAVFAVLAIVSMVTFRTRIYDRVRGRAAQVRTGPANEVLTLPVALAPGQSCQAEHAGTFWTVRNDSDAPIPSGGRARIARVEGLTLSVRPDT